jgi:GTP-binding protein
MTNMENEAAVVRLQRTLDRAGVVKKLRAIGAKEGDTVRIGTIEFDYIDEDADEKDDEEEEDDDE